MAVVVKDICVAVEAHGNANAFWEEDALLQRAKCPKSAACGTFFCHCDLADERVSFLSSFPPSHNDTSAAHALIATIAQVLLYSIDQMTSFQCTLLPVKIFALQLSIITQTQLC